ncbi:MAG: penicillin-binding protein 2 [Anaerolineales bacterium]|nr:penicillin-binding protein 2 [Anaerolineales bacterium]
MMGPKIPRRIFLKGLGVALLVTSCSPEIATLPFQPPTPTPTPLPTPTPTPLPSADAVSQTYLSAWARGDYGTMYSLLTPESQLRLNFTQFQSVYTDALTQATVKQVATQPQSLLHTGDQASVTFRSVWQTHLFGNLSADNSMRLKFSQGRWGVEWQPTLVLPQLGEGVSLVFLSEQPARGNIYDKNFHALATQGQMVTVGVIPQFLKDEQKVINYLSTLTKVPPDKIKVQIDAARPDWFVPVGEITFEASLENDNMLVNLAGVDRRAHEVRTYNDGETGAHIIGYMGKIPAEEKQEYLAQGYQGDELVGLAGIERWAERDLAGQRGGRLVTLSSSRQVLSEIATLRARAGSSVYLTVDTPFQATVEQLLGTRLGAVVVMDPNSGALYALASYPRFKPAVFTTGFDVDAWAKLYSSEKRPLLNRATQGLYPPASVFKVVTISAALEALGLQPDMMFVCTGKWDGLGKQFEKKCWLQGGHGRINLVDGLTQSCDVVFYELGLALHRQDPQLLPNWARAFGLGVPTDLLGLTEGAGVVPDEAWKQANLSQPLFDGDAVNTAIGQGYMLATPLQIARLLAAVGNGGRLLRPRVIDKIVAVDGSEQPFEPEVAGTLPLSPESLDLIRRSLEAVVSGARGTARSAFNNITYTVAGKTGTAESGQEKPHAWFAGYTPADEPRVAIAVILEHAGEGSKEAAPLFRRVVEAFFEWEAKQI